MSDHCGNCEYDPKRRTGEGACPLTTLYWDFIARHRERLAGNGRMRNALAGLRRLDDLEEVRDRAEDVLKRLEEGKL